MSTLVNALKEQNDLLERQVETYAAAVDNLAAKLTDAYARLRPHDPDYVAGMLGEVTVETIEAAVEGEIIAPGKH